MNARLIACLLAAVGLLLAACSGDTPTGAPTGSDPDFVSGDLQPAGPGFEVAVAAADCPAGPRTGPFILRGENLRRVPEQGALAVDLTIENAGRETHPEPVGLTFVALIPDSVRVLDADNGLEGPGAAIVFPFANDDAMWTPGEVSLPRTVHFAAAEGASIAFAARLDLAAGPLTGVISGVVFNDLDRDGVRGEGEGGLPNVPVVLVTDGPWEDGGAKHEDRDDHDDEDCEGEDCGDDDADGWRDGGDDGPTESLRFVLTDADGRYAFTGLPAGFHTVRAVPMPPADPTTPTELHVLLAMLPDGTVSTFAHADFGFWVEQPGGAMELPPAADTTVRADLPDRMNDNYGCDPYVAVGRGRAGEPDRIRGLVRFDLPMFFAPVELMRATLRAPVAVFRDGTGQTYRLAVHAVAPGDTLTPWIEGNGSEHVDFGVGCEWVDPAFGVAWVGAGDGGDANNRTQPRYVAEPAAVATVVQDSMAPVVMAEWDVTGLVRAWFDGSLPNHGLVIRDTDEPGDFRSLWFAAREGEEAGLGQALRLVLEFADMPAVR